MNKKLLVIATICFCQADGYAQQAEKQHIIMVGAGNYQLKDQTVSANTINSVSHSLDYAFQKTTATKIFSLGIGWQGAKNSDKDVNISMNNVTARMAAGFLLNRKVVNSRFSAYMGYSIDINTSFNKVKEKTPEQISWATVNALNFYQSYQYKWNSNALALNIDIPIVALISRPETTTALPSDINGLLYASYSNLSFAGLNKNRSFALSLDYKKTISNRCAFVANVYYKRSGLKTTMPALQQTIGCKAGIALSIK